MGIEVCVPGNVQLWVDNCDVIIGDNIPFFTEKISSHETRILC